MACRLSPALKMAEQFWKRHGIEHPAGRHPTFTGHFDAPMHVIELSDGVGVRIDA